MKINTDTLNYYVENASISLDALRDSVKNIDDFLTGEKQPTFNQLSEIAKKLNIPTGLFFLDRVVEVKSSKLEFRTIDSSRIDKISEELRDTIIEMEGKQAFLRDEIEFKLDFIGSCSTEESVTSVASKIRTKLQISEYFQKELPKGKILNFLKEKINRIGVFVFFNGKVGDNIHRPLSLEEFRGFVLTDDKAPIIFINQKDETMNGRVFTLIHELVHLFIGTDEILTEADAGDYVFDETEVDAGEYVFDEIEAFVNKVTAEILVPINIFRDAALRLSIAKPLDERIRIFSDQFKVSEFVIIRRLYDIKFIDKKTYDEKTSKLKEKFKELRRNKSKSSSDEGNYHNNLHFRIDGKFFDYVEQALQQNRISYTDAFSIIGVSFKGYKSLLAGKQ